MSELALVVDSQLYGGWTDIDVRLGVERVAGSFELKVVELWPDAQQVRDIPVGARCEIRIGDETVISGWVDEVEPEYDAESHKVAVRGRDATGDLVDCSAYPYRQWERQTIAQIARDLCQPFGVRVDTRADVGEPFQDWKVTLGETVFENLLRAAKQRGLLLISDGRGGLLITRASQARVPAVLERGINILTARGIRSHLERFRDYRVLGQQPDGDDIGYGEQATEVSAFVRDAAVTRHRPLVLIAEDSATPKSAADRAAWERNTRAGRAVRAEITVQGWHHAGGLWRPNAIVPVRDPWLRIDRDLYISAVQYRLGAGGTTCTLTLTLPEAFDTIALPDPDEEPLL